MNADRRLDAVRHEAASCKDCDLWRPATQTVFGEGPVPAELMLMGEVPGDREDRAGAVFVGPAGRVLDDALEAAGIDRAHVYLTNAVKHFKFETRGKVRIHKKPNAAEITACRQWWEQELALVQPRVLGLLGATAAQAVLGRDFRVTKQRGLGIELNGRTTAIATIHPSAVLRAQDRRDEEYAGLVDDFRVMVRELDHTDGGSVV
ncbi:MAG TPA: UdgX family uracil-DNA binding protein [Acidimicrobiia bacterium]|nr:UdgX family uracil-DNA binding protein [Acidimicrobiia bacterium]